MRSLRPLACLAPAAALLLAPGAAAAEDESPPLSIYGFARLDVLVNDSRMSSLEDPAFVLSEPEGGQLESGLSMTPRLSRVGLSIDRWDIKDGRIYGEGKLEIDFGGGGSLNAIRLRHAYASIARERWPRSIELLAGQTWDLTSPLFPSAQNDGQLRYAGNLGDRRPQLRLSLTPITPVHFAIAAAAPRVLEPDAQGGEAPAAPMASAQPMIQWLAEVRMRVAGGATARMGVSGHVGRAELADGTAGSSVSAGVHFYMPFTKLVVILGEAYLGRNLAELGGGVGNARSMSRDGTDGMGGWLELALLPTERHMLSVGTSIDIARSEALAPGDRERNGTIYTVLRYKPREALQLGLEHLYWKTEYQGMAGGVANRMNMHFSVFF